MSNLTFNSIQEEAWRAIEMLSFFLQTFNADIPAGLTINHNFLMEKMKELLQDQKNTNLQGLTETAGILKALIAGKIKRPDTDKKTLITNFVSAIEYSANAIKLSEQKDIRALQNLTNAFYFVGLLVSGTGEKIIKTNTGKRGAQIKHKPTQEIKDKIKIEWIKRREYAIANRKKAQFCRDMQNEHKDEEGNDLIKDVKTIEGWITDWERNL